MKKFICIHGHFYQPPRENPWLEDIEIQESASPYANWNERINEECYAPNAASRVLGPHGHIVDIVNNYAKISFNFGPTLLSWMEKADPETYALIQDSDRLSRGRFSGHGSAMAQSYNHMIMPLANARDRRTQVLWGVKDFEHRFGRLPEGMWIPETAVNMEVLDVMAEAGIAFTVLAPHQARSVRKIGEKTWAAVANGSVDTQFPYICRLPSGRQIAVFFYDGPVSHDVAFSGLLRNGEAFAGRLAQSFPPEFAGSRLTHIATDGESYGHHHRFGNMALTYCLHVLEKDEHVSLTVYGEYLAKNPPQYEVQIVENSSWSCAHGVERWRADCGCRIAAGPLHQKWREPLRKSLDWLRDSVALVYEAQWKTYSSDPWRARDEYIEVILDRSPDRVSRFLSRHAGRDLPPHEQTHALKLLEMQRNAMLMYTSCGWFFDEISGIESTQILRYAARVIHLTREVSGQDFEPGFLKILKTAPSNLPEYDNGAVVYERSLRSSVVDAQDVAVHYGVAAVRDGCQETQSFACFDVRREKFQSFEKGKDRLLIGLAHVSTNITREQARVDFVVLHLGNFDFLLASRPHLNEEAFDEACRALREMFLAGDLEGLRARIPSLFERCRGSVWDLWKSEQQSVLAWIIDDSLEILESSLQGIYDRIHPLLEAKHNISYPVPKAFAMIAEYTLNRDLIRVLEKDPLEPQALERIVKLLKQWSFGRDRETVSLAASHRIAHLAEMFVRAPENAGILLTMREILRILNSLPLVMDLWKAQNVYFVFCRKQRDLINRKLRRETDEDLPWAEAFEDVGYGLKIWNPEIFKGMDI
ncbi:MAG: DUF3536 domain-containing protein [Candidatus Omnitrophota bacterium]|nr:DUF3536 domain-containing protein [Candidatus Omnitrophota bacterium]MDZ4243457.1 DUF3536 domain-containing protein [Candidatus Omnitrophota bacterium]